MKRVLMAGAAVAAAATLAACGGGGNATGGGSDGSSGNGTPTQGATTVSADTLGSAGTVLVDSSGRALYASNQETNGKVLCTGGCTSFWMPLTVSGAPSAGSLPGRLGTVTRPDGTRQVTYDGKLLYSFTQDSPGQVTGDGLADAFGGRRFTWHVVHPDGSVGSSNGGAPTGGKTGGGLYG
jgi:predicted lipoprotein with Yx(FWY)xxD motif